VPQAIARREELMRQRTAQMHNDWSDEFNRLEGVAWAVKFGGTERVL